jgi:VWFA-related protein
MRTKRAMRAVGWCWAAAAAAWAASVQAGAAAPTPGDPAGGGEPAAQAAAGRPDESFAESIEVTVVNVDVVVRDGAGKQVPGLTRGDFALFEDGKKVEITNFSVPAALGPAASAPPPAPAAPATPAPAAAGPAATAGEADAAGKREQLYLVVFVDNANMYPFDRNRILKQLRGFLHKNVGPGDQVLLVTHDLGLHVRHAFRDSPSSLGAVLDKLEKESARGITSGLNARQVLEQIRDNGCGRVDESQGLARGYAQSVLAEVKVTYANLHHLLESLGGLDGRKVLLYVGDGVPTQAGSDAFGLIQELCNKVASFETLNAAPLLHEVTAAANANRVTFYTLETANQRTTLSGADLAHPLGSFELEQQIRADRQDSLTSLARDTGGRAALNGADLRHDLDEIAADLDGSYSLGFMPSHAGDGKIHALRVEVKRPSLRVSSRASYRDRTPIERLEGQVEAALIHGYGDNPLTASLKLGMATPSEHGRVLVPVQVRVPFGKLAFIPQGDGRHGRVSIFAGNMDDHGGMSSIQRLQVPLRIPEADAKRVLASTLGYDVKLLLAPGRQRIAFAVRDDVARVSSCVTQEVEVDKKGTASAVAAGAAPSSK